jgi:hypothetical protein
MLSLVGWPPAGIRRLGSVFAHGVRHAGGWGRGESLSLVAGW